MKSILFNLFLVATAVGASAATPVDPMNLEFGNGAIQAHCAWKQGPTSSGESILEIDWKNGANQTPIEPGPFSVAIEMPSMPKMQNAPTQIVPTVVGSYLVQSIYFTPGMGGAWVVKVTIKNANGTEETQSFHLQLAD